MGGAAALNVSAVLTTTTPGVTIIQGTSAYPNVGAGSFVTNITPFQVTTLPSFACGTPVVLSLKVTFNSTTNTLSFTLPGGSGGGYSLTTSTRNSIVPGTTDVGNHGDDVTTSVALPFNYSFYGQTFSSITVDSNGKLHFTSSPSEFNNTCIPTPAFPNTVFALWDDLSTASSGGGIFTSTTGVAPNRIFNVEWRATYLNNGLSCNFEVRLYEGQQRVDLVYGTLNDNGSSATVGIKRTPLARMSLTNAMPGGLSSGLQLTFSRAAPMAEESALLA